MESLYTVLPILSIINFASIAIILYANTQPYLLVYAPWIALWMFMLVLLFVVVVLMVVAYLFIIPSMWTFRGKQIFGHESKVIDEIRELREEIQELKEKK